MRFQFLIGLATLSLACGMAIAQTTLPSIDTTSPKSPGKADANPTFKWSKVPNAAYYVVDISFGGKDFDNADHVQSKHITDGDSYKIGERSINLQTGVTYFWKVTAYDANNTAIASSTPQSFTQGSVLDELDTRYGLSLKRTSAPGQDILNSPMGGVFSFSNTTGKGGSYTLDGDLEWKPNFLALGRDRDWFPFLGVEAHFSDADNAPQDVINTQIGIDHQFGPLNISDGLFKGLDGASLFLRAPLKFETDHEFRTENFAIAPSITPVIRGIMMGEEAPLFWQPNQVKGNESGPPGHRERQSGAWFSWAPSVTSNFGRNLKSPVADHYAIERVGGQVDLTFHLYSLANFLKVRDAQIVVSEKEQYLMSSEGGAADVGFHDLFTAVFQLSITQNLNILAQYKSGEDAPKFTRGESFSLGLGLSF